MSRRHQLFLRDIQAACRRLREYREQICWTEPDKSPMAIDAVLHNLMILGEATKNLPPEVRTTAANIGWRKIAGL